MTFETLLRNRRSVRKYQDSCASEKLIQEMIYESIFAPNAGNEQPWKFIIVNKKSMLKRISDEGKKNISTIFSALPQLPVLFLFNDADDMFPAQASILYERRAEYVLDAECRVMIDWYLLEHLKSGEKN